MKKTTFTALGLLLSISFQAHNASASCSEKWADRFFKFQNQADIANTVAEDGFGVAAIAPLVFWLVALPSPFAAVSVIAGGSALVGGYTTEGIKLLQIRHAQKTLSIFPESYANGVLFAPTDDGITCSRTIGADSLEFVSCSTVEPARVKALSSFVQLVQSHSQGSTPEMISKKLAEMNETESLCRHHRIPTEKRLAQEIADSLNSH